MEELEKTGTYLEQLFSSDKLVGIGEMLISLLLIILVGLVVIKLVLHITRKSLKKSDADPVVYTFIQNAVKAVCIIILITVCLGAIGIPMSTIVAVVGAAGAAIALALRDSLANIAGGVMIIITKPFNKDDLIDIGEVSGKVESIDLFLTTLKTYDNKTITIPNGLINTSILVNHSKEEIRRVDCTFGIGYNNDIHQAKQILQNVCDVNPDIMKKPQPLIGVANHGDNSVMLDLKVWCDTESTGMLNTSLRKMSKLHLMNTESKFHTRRWMFI